MAIVNRSNDGSQQNTPVNFIAGDLTNGQTGVIGYIPYPCVLVAANIGAMAQTGTPDMFLTLQRFIVGAGVTVFAIGSTFQPPAFGTSGVIPAGVSLPAVGNTLLNLIPGDVLGYQIGGGTTVGIWGCAGSFVVKPLQDIKVFLNGLA